MADLDRLGWAAGLSLVSYGVRVGIRATETGVLEQVKERLPPGWKPTDNPLVEHLFSLKVGGVKQRGVKNFHLAFSGIARIARTMDLNEALDYLESHLKIYVAERARRRVFVHAGVVVWRGKAIVLPGRSLSGKTTLVAELVKAGATYYSDEYAVLDEAGRVHPYAQPLAIRESERLREQTRYPVEALGGAVGKKAAPVGLVVVSKYQPNSHWRPRQLSPGQGVLELLANTVPAQSRPQESMQALHQAVAQATVLKSSRGEAKDVARALLDAVA